MSPGLKDFLRENRDLLEDRDWKQLYHKLEYGQTSEFTELILNTLKIDPARELGYIPKNYLYNSKNIQNYKIPENVKSIGDDAFCRCFSLTNVIIPNSVISIGLGAFEDCSKLKSIIIPDSVTSIGSIAFGECTNLTSVVIGNGVTSIGKYTFFYCTSLTNIEIPNSVTSIGEDAFYGCNSLTKINYKGTKEQFLNIKIKDKSIIQKIICSDGEIIL